MIFAISLNGNQRTSEISERFARCGFFAIYNDDTGKLKFIENPNKDIKENAGHATVAILRKYNAEKVIAGEFGTKVKSELDELKIQMIIITDPRKTLNHILEMLKKKRKLNT